MESSALRLSPADAVAVQCEQSQASVDCIRLQMEQMRGALRDHKTRMDGAQSTYISQLVTERREALASLDLSEHRVALLEKQRVDDTRQIASQSEAISSLQRHNAEAATQVHRLEAFSRQQEALAEEHLCTLGRLQLALQRYHEDLHESARHRLIEREAAARAEATMQRETCTLRLLLAAKEKQVLELMDLADERGKSVALLEQLRSADIFESNAEAARALRAADEHVESMLAVQESRTTDILRLEQRVATERAEWDGKMTEAAVQSADEIASLRQRLEEQTRKVGSLELELAVCTNTQASASHGADVTIRALTSKIAALEQQREADESCIKSLRDGRELQNSRFQVHAAMQTEERGDKVSALWRELQLHKESMSGLQRRAARLEDERVELLEQLRASQRKAQQSTSEVATASSEAERWRQKFLRSSFTNGLKGSEIDDTQGGTAAAAAAAASPLKTSTPHDDAATRAELVAERDELARAVNSNVSLIETLTKQNQRLQERLAAAESRVLAMRQSLTEAEVAAAPREAAMAHARREVDRFKDDLARLYHIYKEEHQELLELRERVEEQEGLLDSKARELEASRRGAADASRIAEEGRQSASTMEVVVQQQSEELKCCRDQMQRVAAALSEVLGLVHNSGMAPEIEHSSCTVSADASPLKHGGVDLSGEAAVTALVTKLRDAVRALVSEAQFCVDFAQEVRRGVEERIVTHTSDEALHIAIQAALQEMEETISGEDSGFKAMRALASEIRHFSRATSFSSQSTSTMTMPNSEAPFGAVRSRELNMWIQGWGSVEATVQLMAYVVTNHSLQLSATHAKLATLRGVLAARERDLRTTNNKLARLLTSAQQRVFGGSLGISGVSEPPPSHVEDACNAAVGTVAAANSGSGVSQVAPTTTPQPEVGPQNTTALTTSSLVGAHVSVSSLSLSPIDVSFVIEQQVPLSERLRKAITSIEVARRCAERVHHSLVEALESTEVPTNDEEGGGGGSSNDNGDHLLAAGVASGEMAPGATLADELLPAMDKCTSTLRRVHLSLQWVVTHCILPDSVFYAASFSESS